MLQLADSIYCFYTAVKAIHNLFLRNYPPPPQIITLKGLYKGVESIWIRLAHSILVSDSIKCFKTPRAATTFTTAARHLSHQCLDIHLTPVTATSTNYISDLARTDPTYLSDVVTSDAIQCLAGFIKSISSASA